MGRKQDDQIKTLLERQYQTGGEFDLAMSELSQLQTLIRERNATVLAPLLNSYIANQPQHTRSEKLALAGKIRSALQTLGLSLCYPGSAEPANIFVEKSGNSPNGRFQLDLRSRTDGHKRQSFSNHLADAPFFPFQLMPDPLEPTSWSARIVGETSSVLRDGRNRRASHRSRE